MTATADSMVRHAAATIMAAAVVSPMAAAQIYEWNALSHNLAEWPGLFGDPRHGWIIKQRGDTGTRKNTVLDKKILEYDVWGFYGFRSGMVGDNSDDEFSIIRDAMYQAIRASNHLELEGTVERHELLQFPDGSITTIDCGEETLHFAGGKLTVHLCC